MTGEQTPVPLYFKVMKRFTVFVILLLAAVGLAGQQELMVKQAKELLALKRVIYKNIKVLEKISQGDVYIRARIIEGKADKYFLSIEEVKVDRKTLKTDETDLKTIFLKGKVTQKKDKNFYLDIQHVLPKPGAKTEQKQE